VLGIAYCKCHIFSIRYFVYILGRLNLCIISVEYSAQSFQGSADFVVLVYCIVFVIFCGFYS